MIHACMHIALYAYYLNACVFNTPRVGALLSAPKTQPGQTGPTPDMWGKRRGKKKSYTTP